MKKKEQQSSCRVILVLWGVLVLTLAAIGANYVLRPFRVHGQHRAFLMRVRATISKEWRNRADEDESNTDTMTRRRPQNDDAPPETPGSPIPGCPAGPYMSTTRRLASESALREHWDRLITFGYIGQDYAHKHRGLTRFGNATDVNEWTGHFDVVTSDIGYTLFESPEWPKPRHCRQMWGPTNGRWTGEYKHKKAGGRIDFPNILLQPGPSMRTDGDDGIDVISIAQGYKLGTQFLRQAFLNCGVTQKNPTKIVAVPDEARVHTIGLTRDPLERLISGYKEIVFRLQWGIQKDASRFHTNVSWSANDNNDHYAAYPGLLNADSCMDWLFVGLHQRDDDDGEQSVWDMSPDDEGKRFRAFLDVLQCSCRFHDWQHVASATWWMGMRRTVENGKLDTDEKRHRARTKLRDNFIIAVLPNTIDALMSHDSIVHRGFGAHRIDEVWDIDKLSDEVTSLISRFQLEQDEHDDDECQHQKPRTYYGTTEEKDRRKSSLWGPKSDTLKDVLAKDEELITLICDTYAQDYICFGFEPPPECEALRNIMTRHGLIVSKQ